MYDTRVPTAISLFTGMVCSIHTSLAQSGGAPDASPRIRVHRSASKLLVHADDAAHAVGWQAKLVTPGKLLTFCREGVDGICVPVQLSAVTFENASDGLYVDAPALEGALGVRFRDDGKSVTLQRIESPATSDDVPAYNATWGNGRGFRLGQTLPDIPLIDLDGREVRFSKFLGKQVVIYSWASW